MTEGQVEAELNRMIRNARHIVEGHFERLKATRALKVAIVGSRKGVAERVVREFVERLPLGTIVISGGARGVDQYAERAARNCGLEVFSIRANWKRYGRGAGFKRNIEIVQHADIVVAFWNGESKGTAHTIRAARQLGKPTRIYTRGDTYNEAALEGGVGGLEDETRPRARERKTEDTERGAASQRRPPVGSTRRPRTGSASPEQRARDLGQIDCL